MHSNVGHNLTITINHNYSGPDSETHVQNIIEYKKNCYFL